MRTRLLIIILLCSGAASAQPEWSPHTLAQRENDWMRDSLHLPPKKLHKAFSISETYYDALVRYKLDTPMQVKAATKKDSAMKPLFTHTQYQKYISREKELRRARTVKYEGKHQPY